MHDAETRARLALSGDLELGVAGVVTRLTRLELASGGTFADPQPPVRLQLRGRMSELRRLGRAWAPVGDVLALRVDAPDDADASVTLVARPAHVERLRKEAQRMQNDLDPQELLQREGWMAALFSLDGYDAESVATHETLPEG